MKRIITLLDKKNHCLEKFYATNEDGIAKFSAGDFSGLDYFYSHREDILKMIKYIDDQIQVGSSQHLESTPEDKEQIKECLKIKDEYVSRILAQDIEILEFIEKAKSEIIRDLQDVSRAKKAVSSYKSPTHQRKFDSEF